jgi:hypothetical protein
MLDQLRQQIQTHLDELLGEADKLRRALGALGSAESGEVIKAARGYQLAGQTAAVAPADAAASAESAEARRRAA